MRQNPASSRVFSLTPLLNSTRVVLHGSVGCYRGGSEWYIPKSVMFEGKNMLKQSGWDVVHLTPQLSTISHILTQPLEPNTNWEPHWSDQVGLIHIMQRLLGKFYRKIKNKIQPKHKQGKYNVFRIAISHAPNIR